MPALTALLLATPIFGLSLQPPDLPPLDLESNNASVQLTPEPAGESEQDRYVAAMKRRNALVPLHRAFGIATWAAMTATVVLGSIQYYNLYGFFAGQGDNPCVRGEAIFGQGQCTGPPGLHLAAAAATTGLYLTTGTIAWIMPDPDDLASGPGEFAATLRRHKLLRWIHMSGMLVQAVFGVFVANPGLLGLDRANDYDTLQMMATAHMATGLVTYGALTWAGSLMIF